MRRPLIALFIIHAPFPVAPSFTWHKIILGIYCVPQTEGSARKPKWGPTRASFGMPISCRAYWLNSTAPAQPQLSRKKGGGERGSNVNVVGGSFKRKHCPIRLAFCATFACRISLLYCLACYWCQLHEFWHGNAWRWHLFCICNVTFTSLCWMPHWQISAEVKRASTTWHIKNALKKCNRKKQYRKCCNAYRKCKRRNES